MRSLLVALILFAAIPGHAADCATVPAGDVNRSGEPWGVVRIILADGKTTNTTSTKCTPPTIKGPSGTTIPWDHYEFFGEDGDTCTSWSAEVRHYPANDTDVCRGTCDAHSLVSLAKGSTTSKFYADPLGEGMDVVTTNVTCSDGVSIFADFYYRNFGK